MRSGRLTLEVLVLSIHSHQYLPDPQTSTLFTPRNINGTQPVFVLDRHAVLCTTIDMRNYGIVIFTEGHRNEIGCTMFNMRPKETSRVVFASQNEKHAKFKFAGVF